jgi:hypothetical protein
MSKVDLRIPQIARMRVAGQKDAVIAGAVGLTPQGLARILSLPEYKDVERAVLTGTVTKMDMALAGNRAALCQEFKVGVPLAMRTLLEAVQQRRDLRASLEAAKEILDRDPDRVFTKSRADGVGGGPPTLDAGTLASLSGNADKVATSLKGVVASAQPPVADSSGTNVVTGTPSERIQ